MKRLAIFLLVLGTLGIYQLFNQPVSKEVQVKPVETVLSTQENELTRLTNEQRQALGLLALIESAELNRTAQAKCEDMQTNNYWSHDSPTRSWSSFLPEKDTVGENLAKNYTDYQKVTEGWMNSPKHRDNIVDKSYTYVGFAECDGPQGHLIVQHFSST